MAFCSECGNDIGTDKFCSKCGKSSDGINPDIKKDDRDITEAVIHLKALSNLSSSVIIPDDIKMYEEALFKINDEKFRSFSASLNRYKKVTEINRHLEIDQKVTDKMLKRAYGKDFKKDSSNKASAGKAIGIFVMFLFIVFCGLVIKKQMQPDPPQKQNVVSGISNDDACDCLKSFVENNSSKQLSCVNEYYDSAFDYVEINYPNDRFQNQEAVLQRYFYDKCSM